MDRRRLGILLASANTTIEHEFRELAGDRASVHATRLAHRKLTPETLESMRRDAVAAARLLADAEVDCIVYGITAASFLLGEEHDRTLVAEITEATGTPAITVLQGVLHQLESLAVKRLALGTPYPEDITDREAAFLANEGFSVTGVASLGQSDVAKIGRLSPETAIDVAGRAVRGENDALFLSCTNWHVLPVLGRLQEALSLPVFSSNTAAFDLAMHTSESS